MRYVGVLRSLLWLDHRQEAGLVQEVRQSLPYGSQRILSAGMLRGHVSNVERFHIYASVLGYSWPADSVGDWWIKLTG